MTFQTVASKRVQSIRAKTQADWEFHKYCMYVEQEERRFMSEIDPGPEPAPVEAEHPKRPRGVPSKSKV